jgi:hypothetical protein
MEIQSLGLIRSLSPIHTRRALISFSSENHYVPYVAYLEFKQSIENVALEAHANYTRHGTASSAQSLNPFFRLLHQDGNTDQVFPSTIQGIKFGFLLIISIPPSLPGVADREGLLTPVLGAGMAYDPLALFVGTGCLPRFNICFALGWFDPLYVYCRTPFPVWSCLVYGGQPATPDVSTNFLSRFAASLLIFPPDCFMVRSALRCYIMSPHDAGCKALTDIENGLGCGVRFRI